MAKILLDNGADINGLNQGGETALTCAAARSHERMVHLLLARGAVNSPEALIRAASGISVYIINTLLDHGADVNFVGQDGKTALDAATERTHKYPSKEGKAVLDLLVERGGRPAFDIGKKQLVAEVNHGTRSRKHTKRQGQSLVGFAPLLVLFLALYLALPRLQHWVQWVFSLDSPAANNPGEGDRLVE